MSSLGGQIQYDHGNCCFLSAQHFSMAAKSCLKLSGLDNKAEIFNSRILSWFLFRQHPLLQITAICQAFYCYPLAGQPPEMPPNPHPTR